MQISKTVVIDGLKLCLDQCPLFGDLFSMMDVTRAFIKITDTLENTSAFQRQETSFHSSLIFVEETFDLRQEKWFYSKFQKVDTNVVICHPDQRVLTPVVYYWGHMH